MRIADWPEDERPRERLLKLGAASMSEAELLAIFLRTGVAGKSAVELGRDLLGRFGSLHRVFAAPLDDVAAVRGLGPAKYVQLQAVIEMVRRALAEQIQGRDAMSSPQAVRDYLRLSLGARPHEVFVAMFSWNVDCCDTFPRKDAIWPVLSSNPCELTGPDRVDSQMILLRYLRDLRKPAAKVQGAADIKPRVLNVGGGSKDIPLPLHYANWCHDLLDIDPKGKPDVICDARELQTLAASQYDAVYCSHNLEHYYHHDGPMVLKGFLHVLRPDGFAELRVPDMNTVMKRVVESGLDIEDVLYQSPSGPISVRDVFYGYAKQIESSGMDFYAHKTGFTVKSLRALLMRSGFPNVYMFVAEEAFEVRAVAFKKEPTAAQHVLLGLPASA